MNKKLIISLSIISAAIFISGVTYADDLKETLELYLADPSLDFLGHEFEDIFFKSVNEVRNGKLLDDAELLEKLKFIIDDFKTMGLQAKAYHKIFTNKVNAITYGSLGGLWGLKVGLGAKEFGKVMVNIIKLGMK